MMSRAVEKRLRILAQALWLRHNIIYQSESRKWLSYKEVMKEVRSFFKHTQTRKFYFEQLLECGFLKEETTKGRKNLYIPKDPSEVKTRDFAKYLQSLRKTLEENDPSVSAES